jgi:hypothetical protein
MAKNNLPVKTHWYHTEKMSFKKAKLNAKSRKYISENMQYREPAAC